MLRREVQDQWPNMKSLLNNIETIGTKIIRFRISTFSVDNLPVTLWRTVPNPLVSSLCSILRHHGAEQKHQLNRVES